ncbi:MAG: glycosyltransferase, partial [Cyanobacteria bacterium P01_H01_bin.153]
DGIPNVLLEAMAIGLPVVSTAISGITELVQSGQNGLLVAEKDAAALAAALHQLADDEVLRRQLGLAGRRQVQQNFTLAGNVGQVKAYLLQALQAPAPQPPTPSAPAALSTLLEAMTP